jgi:hypothetical protein
MSLYLEVSDETETINIHASNIIILRGGYSMESPSDQEMTANDGWLDGDDVISLRYGNVAETVRLFMQGGLPTVRSNIQALNRMFQRARRYAKRRVGPRIFVRIKAESGDEQYRTRVFTGRVALGADALDMQLINGKMEVILDWTRQPFWEGPLTSIPLSNANGTGNISGLTVYNHNDAGAGNDNFVTIAAADVDGDMPAPVKIVFTNTYASATKATGVFIGHNVLCDPENFEHILEAESASNTSPEATGTVTADAAYSNGSYVSCAWSGTDETDLLHWTLSQSLLDMCKGNYFRVLIRSEFTVQTVQLRLKILTSTTPLYTSEWITYIGNTDVQEITAIKLPPTFNNVSANAPLKLVLEAKDSDAGAKAIKIDFIQLTPLDGWRRYFPIDRTSTGGIPTNESLIDDMIEGTCLLQTAAAQNLASYIGYGRPIMVWPGEVQRLYFLWRDFLGDALPARTAIVQLTYRPRRMTI